MFDGRYVVRLIRYSNYIDIERLNVELFYIAYVPVLKGGEEVGMVEPHLWVLLLDYGEIEVYEVRNVVDVKTILEKIKRVVKNNTVAVLQIEAKVRDLDTELLEIAFNNVEHGASYLRGLIADTIMALVYNVDKDTLCMFVKQLKEQEPLLEALKIKDLIVAEVMEVMKTGNKAIVEKLEVLKELGISLEEH